MGQPGSSANEPPVVAEIRIFLRADGNIGCAQKGADRKMFLMMMEVAKFDMERLLKEREASLAPAVQLAPPGMEVARNER